MALGVYLFFKWFPLAYPGQPKTLSVLMPGFYANCITTILGTGFTVLFFDTLTKLRDERLDQVRLIRDIGCGDQGLAMRAVMEITRRDLHRNKPFRKSILRNQMLPQVRLVRAELWNADLSYSSFHHSNFTAAELVNATLYLTSFWGCRLHHVDFSYADTTNTDFIFADLTKAVIKREQLRVAYRLHGATLPDGKLYDGSFNLSGDIQSAEASGFDVADPIAMAKFYAMSEKQLHSRFYGKDKPEYTDWGN